MMSVYDLQNKKPKAADLKPEELQALNDIPNVADKMTKLVSLIELSQEQLEVRKKESAELRELLRKYYPDCMLLAFGSTVNGFGLKHSDLDILFLPFPGYCNVDFKLAEGAPKPQIPKPEEFENGTQSKDFLTKLDEMSHLYFIRNILKKNKKFSNRQFLNPKHCPTLKLHLVNSKIACDLVASNRLVVYNSELLEFFGKFDPRVRPLVITLRYWAQRLGLIRQKFFTCYTFTLLVIFYLQNTNPPILMSAKRLMEKAGYSRLIAGWQTAITDVPLPKSRNHASLEDLLLGFFQFYWNYDFSQNVISVHHGRSMPVSTLKNDRDKRMSEFQVASVNVQDPFILNLNTCKREGSAAILKMVMFTAYQMLQDKAGSYGFNKLFDFNAYNKIFELHFDRYAFSESRAFHLSLDHQMISHMRLNLNDPKNALRWFQQGCQAVFDVLQYGLLMDCEVIDQTAWSVPKPLSKMEMNGAPVINLAEVSGAKNSPFDLHLLIALQCYIYDRVWIGRKQLTPHLIEDAKNVSGDEFEDFSHPVLKTEYQLSKAMIKVNPVLNSVRPLMCFRCECYKHASPQISDIVVILKPLAASKEFLTVFPYLQGFITRTVKRMMSPAD